MPNLTLRVPELGDPVALALAPDAVVLIGRDPDVKRLPRELRAQIGSRAVQIMRFPSRRVSSNHLLLICCDDGVQVSDLNSRNGTMMLAPRRQSVLLPTLDVTLSLAVTPQGDPRVDGPKPADWTSERDFSVGVARALALWFQSLDVTVMMRTAPRRASGTAPDAAGELGERSDGGAQVPESPELSDCCFPLADDTELHVEVPTRSTYNQSWATMLDTVQRYISEQNTRFEQLRGPDDGFIIGSRALRDAHQQVAEAAGRSMRVMLLGPTGAGKDRLARRYHQLSRQHRGPYATLNCALLKENLLYAQLFGARKGSFTGCVTDIAGVVEAAHDGTLFLDEVGDMDLEVQKALLRFLDSRGEFQRLGDPKARRVSVQIVCATNIELDDARQRLGRFRDDLWYRLAVKVVRIPPLSERREDIVAYLRSRTLPAPGAPSGVSSPGAGLGGLRVYDALSPAALARVLDDPWPGNFRDLENFVERLPPTSTPQSIDEALCTAALQEGRGASRTRTVARPSGQLPIITEDGTWPEVTALASAAFAADHGNIPKTWGQIQLYTEKYLKPVFIAHASGLAHLDEISKSVNFSELARRLNIADGTTVKMHLQRYIERFRRQRADGPSEPAQG